MLSNVAYEGNSSTIIPQTHLHRIQTEFYGAVTVSENRAGRHQRRTTDAVCDVCGERMRWTQRKRQK